MYYKITRQGPTESYPWESAVTYLSTDGKEWRKASVSDAIPKDFIDDVYSYKISRYEYKEWVCERPNIV